MKRARVLLVCLPDWSGPARLPAAFVEAGYEVAVFAPPTHRIAQSKHVSERIDAPADLQHFMAALEALMATRADDFAHALACDDWSVFALAERRDQRWTHRLLPAPTEAVHLDFLVSKLLFPIIGARQGLPVPRTRVHADPAALHAAALATGFPLVAKQARGFAGMQIHRVDDAAALDALIARLPAGTPLALQPHIEGRAGSCCAVWVRGRLKAWFTFLGVVQWPESTSQTSVVELVDRPLMVGILRRVGEISGYHGLGGIDFIESPDGSITVLEQHARPIPQFVLARQAGIDLAAALRAVVEDDVEAPRQRPMIDTERIAQEELVVPLFPQEAERMILAGEARLLKRWRTDRHYRQQLFRDDRPLHRATQRHLQQLMRRAPDRVVHLDGVYLNLARSHERRAAMRAQIDALGLPWIRRFEAVDGERLAAPSGPDEAAPSSPLVAGEIGCFASHLAAIERGDAEAFTVVLEDDVMLSPQFADVLSDETLRGLADFDLVFLDCQPVPDASLLHVMWRGMRQHMVDASTRRIDGVDFLDARRIYLWAANAYLVTPTGRRRLPSLLRETMTPQPQQPFDVALRKLIAEGRIRAVVLCPFIATTAPDAWTHNTIQGRAHRRSDALHAMLRQVFFAGPLGDWRERAEALLQHHASSDQDAAQERELRIAAALMAELFVAELEETRDSGSRERRDQSSGHPAIR